MLQVGPPADAAWSITLSALQWFLMTSILQYVHLPHNSEAAFITSWGKACIEPDIIVVESWDWLAQIRADSVDQWAVPNVPSVRSSKQYVHLRSADCLRLARLGVLPPSPITPLKPNHCQCGRLPQAASQTTWHCFIVRFKLHSLLVILGLETLWFLRLHHLTCPSTTGFLRWRPVKG